MMLSHSLHIKCGNSVFFGCLEKNLHTYESLLVSLIILTTDNNAHKVKHLSKYIHKSTEEDVRQTLNISLLRIGKDVWNSFLLLSNDIYYLLFDI